MSKNLKSKGNGFIETDYRVVIVKVDSDFTKLAKLLGVSSERLSKIAIKHFMDSFHLCNNLILNACQYGD